MLRSQLSIAGCFVVGWFVVVALLGSGLLATCASAAENAALADAPVYFRHERGLAADDNQPYPEAIDPAKALWRTSLPQGQSTPTLAGDQGA